jgi:hypothetical protein
MTYLGSLEILEAPETPIANTKAKATEPAHADTQESGGVLTTIKVEPAPTKGTTGVELVGVTQSAAATKLEALEPWTEGMVCHSPNTAPQNDLAKGEQVPKALPPQGNVSMCGCGCGHNTAL